jgi:hypothetical protein
VDALCRSAHLPKYSHQVSELSNLILVSNATVIISNSHRIVYSILGWFCWYIKMKEYDVVGLKDRRL